MNDIVLYPSKGWAVLGAVVCLILGTLCIGILAFQGEVKTDSGMLIKLPIFAVILWGLFFRNAYRLFKPVPSFIVNREGITDHATAVKVGLIRWDEIADITVNRDGWVTLLAITVKDPEAFYSRLPKETAAALRESLKRRPVHVGIAQAALPEPVDTLVQRIIVYRRALASGVTPAVTQFASAPISTAAPMPHATDASSAQRCPACGASSQDTKFCPACGHAMPRKTQCSQCGVEVKPTTKFCPECGSKIV